MRTAARMAESSFFKGVTQLRSLTRFCQGSITMEANSVSFPRESTTTDLGAMNEVVLKNKIHGRELATVRAVLVEILNGGKNVVV